MSLVWRATAVPRHMREHKEEIPQAADRRHEQRPPASPEADVAKQPPRFAEPAAPLTIALGPAVLDRLAEDVIHRIERRMRIERERRGL